MTTMGKGPVLPSGMTRRFIEDSLAKAGTLGHEVEYDLTLARVSKNILGYSARCSCGWASSPKTKRIKAFAAAFIHVGDVLGDAAYDDLAGRGGGASPSVPERLGDGAERSRPGGEGESASPTWAVG